MECDAYIIFFVFITVLVAWRCYKRLYNNKERGNCKYYTQGENQQDMCDLQVVSAIKIDPLFQETCEKNTKRVIGFDLVTPLLRIYLNEYKLYVHVFVKQWHL